MMGLGHYLMADSLRTITIALWGVMLAESLWIGWYAVQIRRMSHRLRRAGEDFISVMWQMLALLVLIDVMAVEISWKIVFNGVGQQGVAVWTYPNVFIYLGGVIFYYSLYRIERRRYIEARIRLARAELKAREQADKPVAD